MTIQPLSPIAPMDSSTDAAIPIQRLLSPRSVVIVGASPTPGALGASVLSNLVRNGFKGDIHLINPRRDEIDGRPCLKSIADLPLGVDAAVLAIPRAAVLDAVKALAERQVGAAVIFSAGFAEGGEEGMAEQQEIARVAKAAGMVIEGPNCLGMVNYVDGVPLTFVETLAEPLGDREGVAIVSQSGAMAAVLAVTIASRALGLSYSVSTGNEAASGVEDYVEHLVDDPSTRVIAMIVEQFRKPRRFMAAARAARAAGKTIVLLHPGKSAAARQSAATHTGAMAGDYQVMRTLVERCGVVMAETLEELGDIAEIALRCPVAPSGGTVVLGESGAFKALTLDLCEELDLPLPTIGDEDSPALRAALPEFVGVSNPLDLTAQGLVEPDLYHRTLTALFDDQRFGAVVVGIIQTDPVTVGIKAPPILRAVKQGKPGKPVIFAGLDEGAILPEGVVAQLRAAGVPYFPSTERALRAIKRLNAHAARNLDAADRARVDMSALSAREGVIPEHEAKAILAPLGVSFPKGRLATTADEAVAAATALGYPVVLKAQSADLSHKSDAGGVILGLGDAQAVADGWARLHDNIARHRPGLSLDGVLVEAMGARGVELIIGARNDPDWGPVILVGFGGVQAEILQDVKLLGADLTRQAIVEAILGLKQAPLLTGFRGSAPLDVDAVAAMVEIVGQALLSTPQIREIDLNPVVVYPKGQGAVALDALMLVDRP
ncbi:acetate--CoA ligase family protein [Caulobacter sp. 73W]|uniref:Acetate--CoA ligase family protein n=1 Tax=Caulobacter sp. 73W TaxID=3161137 RepID=A0AB39KWH2_9CAUL